MWAYVLGLLHIMFSNVASVVLAAKIAGAFLLGITAWGVFRVVLNATDSAIAGFITATAVATSPPLLMAAVSGMEVTLGCAAAVWGLALVLERQPFFGGLLLAIASLSRPELASVGIVAGMFYVWSVAKRESPPMDLARITLAPLILGSALFYRNWLVDGRVLPSTFYEKALLLSPMSLPDRIVTGIGMLASYPPLVAGVPILGLIALALLTRSHMRTIGAMFVSAGAAFFLVSITLIPPYDYAAFYHIRYLLPSVPLFATAFGIGISGLAQSGKMNRLRPVAALHAASVLRVTALLVTVVALCLSFLDFRQWSTKLAEDARNIDEVQVDLSKRITRCTPPDWVVATCDAGAVRYLGNRFTIDLMGLNTPPNRLESGFRIYDKSCDILVLLPAWIAFIKSSPLLIVDRKATENYKVTSLKDMAVQILAVCGKVDAHDSGRERVYMTVLGKPVSFEVSCMDAEHLQSFLRLVDYQRDKDHAGTIPTLR